MTDQALHDAILADATAKALADAGNDSGVAARMAAILPAVVAPIDAGHLLIWSAMTGVRLAVEGKVADPNIGAACLAVRDMLGGGAGTLDLTNPTIAGAGGLLDALTSAGVLPANADTTGTAPTKGSKAHLLAYASVPQAIDPAQVSRCLGPYRNGGH